MNGRVFLNSKKILHLVKFQFYMFYINFASEHLSILYDGTVFAFLQYYCLHEHLNQWRSVVDLTTHAISGLCLDDVIMLSLRWYDIFRVSTQF